MMTDCEDLFPLLKTMNLKIIQYLGHATNWSLVVGAHLARAF